MPQLHTSETGALVAKLNKSATIICLEFGCLINHLEFAAYTMCHLCLLYHQKQIFATVGRKSDVIVMTECS